MGRDAEPVDDARPRRPDAQVALTPREECDLIYRLFNEGYLRACRSASGDLG